MLRKAVIGGLIVSLAAISLWLVAHARSGSSKVANQSVSNRVEAELLVLRSDGFKPNEITRPPGPFLLALQNHSSEEELSLLLKREAGDSIKEVRMAKKQSKFKEVLHLPPGRYVLVDTKHPDWACTITIMPH